MDNNVTGPRVLIIGAGVVGLLIAQGLKKNGISFSIYESEPAEAFSRGRQWGVSIQWALPMLPKLLPNNLLNRLQEACVDPDYICPEQGNYLPVYNAETGELVKKLPLVKFARISRSKFRALCCEGIEVQYNKAVESITTSSSGDASVTAHFRDKTTMTGTVLIGTDGANSTVRSSVFAGAAAGKVMQIPYAGINMHVSYHDAAVSQQIRKYLSPIVAMAMHPKGYWLWLSVQDASEGSRPEEWTFQLQWTWKSSADTANLDEFNLENLKAEASRCFAAEPWRAAWESIPTGTRAPNNRITIWNPVPIPDTFSGRVVLAGDAAHAMSFHRGQGLNHGINDALEVVEAISRVTENDVQGGNNIKTLLCAYEAEMIRRAGEEVLVSKNNTEMVHDWERLMASPLMQRGGDKTV